MKANLIGNWAVIVAICVAVAVPLLVRHNASIDAHARDESLRQQQEAIDALKAANLKRRVEIAERKTDALTDEQLKELLRLRAEAGALRKRTNEIAQLQYTSAQTRTGESSTAESKAKYAGDLSAELMEAARKLVTALPDAQERYAAEHGGKSATSFFELRDYFPKVDGRRMPGLYSFDFVRDDGPLAGDELILRESLGHKTADSRDAQIYAFSDGRAEEVIPSGSVPYRVFFDNWERQHLNPAPPKGQ